MNIRSVLAMASVGACLLLSAFHTEALAERQHGNDYSHSDIGFKGWGPRIGFVNPEGALDGTVELGVAFDFGEFVPQLHWDGSVSFWSSGQNFDYYDAHHNHYGYDWTLRDFVLRSGVNYDFLGGELVPYIGGGLALHFFSWDYNGAPYYSNTSDSKVGIYLDGGLEHQFSERWTGQVQIQDDFVSPDQTALLFNLIYHFGRTN